MSAGPDKATLELRKLELEIAKAEREAAEAADHESLRAIEIEQAYADLMESRRALKARKRQDRLERRRLDAREAEMDAFDAAERRHEYRFDEDVYGGSVERCIEQLRQWSEADPGCDITVIFNSPGGSVFDGFALGDFFEHLQSQGHTVTTVIAGLAASMAGALAQYGSDRAITRSSYLHLHEVSTGALGKASDLSDVAELAKRLTRQIAQKYAGRSGGKHTAESVLQMMVRHEVYLSADEALEHGFVDRIV